MAKYAAGIDALINGDAQPVSGARDLDTYSTPAGPDVRLPGVDSEETYHGAQLRTSREATREGEIQKGLARELVQTNKLSVPEGEQGFTYGRRIQDVQVEGEGGLSRNLAERRLAAPIDEMSDSAYTGRRLRDALGMTLAEDDILAGVNTREYGDMIDAADAEAFSYENMQALANDAPMYQSRKLGLTAAAWERGKDEMGQMFYGSLKLLGNATGMEGLADTGDEGMYRNMLEASANPAKYQALDEITWGNAHEFIWENMVAEAPSLLMDLGLAVGGAGVGGVVASQAGRRAVKYAVREAMDNAVGAAGSEVVKKSLERKMGEIAGVTSMMSQQMGEVQGEFDQQGVDTKDAGAAAQALLTAGANTVLDVAPFAAILRRFDTREKFLTKNLMEAAKKAGIDTVKGAGAEAVTEGVQTAITKISALEAAGKTITPEMRQQILDESLFAAAAGAGIGGPLSGAASFAGNASSTPLKKDDSKATAPESTMDLRAQAREMTNPESDRRAVVVSNESDIDLILEEIRSSGGQPVVIPQASGTHSAVVLEEDTEAQELAKDPANNAELLDMPHNAVTVGNDPTDPVIVSRDADGNVLRETYVPADQAEDLLESERSKKSVASADLLTGEEVLADRNARLENEKALNAQKQEFAGFKLYDEASEEGEQKLRTTSRGTPMSEDGWRQLEKRRGIIKTLQKCIES